jgi:hypothetical protein
MSMTEMTILLQDHKSMPAFPVSRGFRIIRDPDLDIAGKAKNLFVFSSATQLPGISEFVRIANRRHQLRALFVREDVKPEWLPQMFSRANVRQVRNMLLHSENIVPGRVITAWHIGAQNQLIADASVLNNSLIVLTCNLDTIEIPLEILTKLVDIPQGEVGQFIIASDGSYLYWPKQDIHLDLDSLRYMLDPKCKQRADQAKLLADKRLGSAVAFLRTSLGLNQAAITGLSERHVRRIEHGERASVKSLTFLAEAHTMELDEYLSKIAQIMRQKNFEETLG